jgi:hypothetical protein
MRTSGWGSIVDVGSANTLGERQNRIDTHGGPYMINAVSRWYWRFTQAPGGAVRTVFVR